MEPMLVDTEIPVVELPVCWVSGTESLLLVPEPEDPVAPLNEWE